MEEMLPGGGVGGGPRKIRIVRGELQVALCKPLDVPRACVTQADVLHGLADQEGFLQRGVVCGVGGKVGRKGEELYPGVLKVLQTLGVELGIVCGFGGL